jgi:hypothetical protein
MPPPSVLLDTDDAMERRASKRSGADPGVAVVTVWDGIGDPDLLLGVLALTLCAAPRDGVL